MVELAARKPNAVETQKQQHQPLLGQRPSPGADADVAAMSAADKVERPKRVGLSLSTIRRFRPEADLGRQSSPQDRAPRRSVRNRSTAIETPDDLGKV
jgi:hypothetical protein